MLWFISPYSKRLLYDIAVGIISDVLPLIWNGNQDHDLPKLYLENFLLILVLCFYFHEWNQTSFAGPSSQNCLYFQDFQGSDLLNVCLVVWPNSSLIQILIMFQWFPSFVIDMSYTVSQRSKQFLRNTLPRYVHER